jgi:ATP/maltotriose-dependent transcriptional regulator MalT/DNA-binding SARP family transcriptional activator
MWQGMADRLRSARVSGVGLYDYLAQQVLDQQPAPVRDFLLRTSHFEEFDAELCEAVLGKNAKCQDLIETVLRSNLFVLLVGDKGTWLRYHHLFRDFLQARLAKEHPDENARILRRLAVVYTERREWEKAHNLYWQLEDVTSIADLIEMAGPSLVKSGRVMILGQWLDALPVDELASRPTLLSLQGVVAQMQGEVDRGLSLHNQAVAAFRRAGDLPNLARALAERAVAHRFLGQYQASLSDAEEVLVLAREDESLRDVRAEALRAKGMSLYQLGKLNEAIRWLQQSLAAYESLDVEQRVAMLRMELGMAYMSAGHYDQALAHNNQALDYWRKAENVAQQANLLNNLGVLQHLIGDYEQANSLLQEALDCAQQSGYTRVEVAALASIGDLYVDLDALDAALTAYYQAYETAQRIDDRFLLLYVGLAEAGVARSRGELAQARELLGLAAHLTQQGNSDFEQGLYQLEAGRLALAEGDTLEAIAQLDGAAHRFDNGGQRLEGARVHLCLALAYQEAKDEKVLVDHLKCAFQLAAGLESQHPMLVTGREVKGLLDATQSDPMLGRQVSQLLRKIIEFERNIPILRRRLRRQVSAVPFGSPKLNIQAFGGIQVTVDGRPVGNSDWQGQAARDLFFYLLTYPDGLTKEIVGTIIWPESSPSQLKLRFKNAIYRLRQALGTEAVLFDEDRYQFNRTLDYEYDVETFTRKLAQAQAATDPDEQVTTYQAAVGIYKGPYWPEAEGEWAWWERERLRQAHMDAIVRLAELHLEAGRHTTALEYCQLALTEDSCLEEAHRLAMSAHAAMGNRAAVVRQYKRCQQALEEEVNVPPSPQTVALYQTLIR